MPAVSLVIFAGFVPNSTVALDRNVPVIVTSVPPAKGPAAGLMSAVMVGAGMYVSLSAEEVVEVPPAVVTVTYTGRRLWPEDYDHDQLGRIADEVGQYDRRCARAERDCRGIRQIRARDLHRGSARLGSRCRRDRRDFGVRRR